MFRKNLLLMLGMLSLLAFTGCAEQNDSIDDISYVYPDSKDVIVTLDEFNNLQSGMSEDEVWDIIGGKCTNTGTTDMGIGDEYITVSYGCNGKGSIGANVILMFQGGKLVTMNQTGLK